MQLSRRRLQRWIPHKTRKKVNSMSVLLKHDDCSGESEGRRKHDDGGSRDKGRDVWEHDSKEEFLVRYKYQR